MTSEVLAAQVGSVAKGAGLAVVSAKAGDNGAGAATTKFTLALAADPTKQETLELSERFEFGRSDLMEGVKAYLAETAKRLKNPRPDCYLTLHGLPLSFGNFGWPFHESTSGADTSLVHGEIRLEDGGDRQLHAKIAASMTVTFRDIVAAPEQPFAEGFIYNAVRKTMDQGQLELVKSGNRQPVPVTTRYYSMKQKKFVFNDTTAEQRTAFLAAKLYWLSGALGSGEPIWLLDPRDAQYLDAPLEELKKSVGELAWEGMLQLVDDGEFAAPTAKLMERREKYLSEMTEALTFIKPTFNEDMRGGLTNM
jgi:hypothetical protein